MVIVYGAAGAAGQASILKSHLHRVEHARALTFQNFWQASWLGSLALSHACHANATCVNTFGSYRCECDNNTYADGLECVSCSAFAQSARAATRSLYLCVSVCLTASPASLCACMDL